MDPLSEPPPAPSPVRAQYGAPRSTFLGVCVKHDDASRVTMLLLDANLHTCRLSTFPKAGEVLKPFRRAPRESNVRRRRQEVHFASLMIARFSARSKALSLALSRSIAQRIRPMVGHCRLRDRELSSDAESGQDTLETPD